MRFVFARSVKDLDAFINQLSAQMGDRFGFGLEGECSRSKVAFSSVLTHNSGVVGKNIWMQESGSKGRGIATLMIRMLQRLCRQNRLLLAESDLIAVPNVWIVVSLVVFPSLRLPVLV